MVDKTQGAGVKGLAAMFNQNISSQVGNAPPPRKSVKKLAVNPFEQNIN